MNLIPPALRAAVSELISRVQLASRAGLTFAGKRDLYAVLGYQRDLQLTDYRDRFRRNGVAKRIVTALPKATWRGGAELVEDEDPETQTQFETAWNELADRLNVWPTFQRADIQARRGEFSVILIGAPGKFEEELPPRLRPQDVAYLTPFPQLDAEVETYVKRQEDPRCGQPEFYKLRRLTPDSNTSTRVHWSRCVHVTDEPVDDNVHSAPSLEAPWNDIDDLEKVKGGGAEAFWLRANQGMQIDVDPDVVDLEDPKAKKELEDEVEEFQHQMRRVIRTVGTKVTPLGSDVANFSTSVDSLLKLISVATEIPVRILTGSERGELASTQDDENWVQRVKDRRASFAAPLVRSFVDRLVAHGALPVPEAEVPGGYTIRWPDMQDLSTDDRLAQAEKAAGINAKMGETVILADEIRDRFLDMPPLEEVTPDDELDVDEEAELLGDEDENEQPRAAARRKRSTGSTRVHRAADAHREVVRRAVASAFAAARGSVSLDELERALLAGPESAERVLVAAIDVAADALAGSLPGRLLDTLVAGGRAAAKSTARHARSGPRAAAGLVGAFDATNPEALRWAEARAAELVRGISHEARMAVRAIIERAFAEGIPPRQAARLIRPLIGLTERQTAAVIELRFKLLEAEPGAIVRAGKVRIKVPATGRISGTAVARHARTYADRLLRQRALTIARHETMEASNEGQHQLWNQAVARGELTGAEQREPIITPDDRLCPICRAMEGQRVGLSEPFTLPDGTRRMNPPFHVACRCSQGITAATARRAHAA